MAKKTSITSWATLGMCALLSAGCASSKPADPQDPYQNYNRHAYQFNDTIDKAVLKPVATVYKNALPWQLRKGIGNVFNNIDELPAIANDLMQANIYYAATDTWRFLINSTVGILGLMDVASDMGLEKHPQDFGLTLAKWGYTQSNYLVLPLFGPSSVRDTIGLGTNYFILSPYNYLIHVDNRTRLELRALALINRRADLLSVDDVIAEASFDPYIFQRDAYIQYRNNLIKEDDAESPEQSEKITGTAGAAFTN